MTFECCGETQHNPRLLAGWDSHSGTVFQSGAKHTISYTTIGSMGLVYILLYLYIYHKDQPNVNKYTKYALSIELVCLLFLALTPFPKQKVQTAIKAARSFGFQVWYFQHMFMVNGGQYILHGSYGNAGMSSSKWIRQRLLEVDLL